MRNWNRCILLHSWTLVLEPNLVGETSLVSRRSLITLSILVLMCYGFRRVSWLYMLRNRGGHVLTWLLAVYKSPQADMGYDIVCGSFFLIYRGKVEAITMHSSFQMVDKTTESHQSIGSQWMLDLHRKNCAF
jgi:hypothetical protein